MPTAYLKKVSKKKGISMDRAEELWNKAKKLAASQGHEDEYDYITGIFKRMIGERLTFSEFHMIFEEGEPTNSVSSGGTSHHSASDGGKPGKMMRRKKKKCNSDEDDCDMIDEKWGIKLQIDKSERGKYKGKTVEELKKELSKLKKSGPHKKGSPEHEKMMELMFAIRAKTGWGKVSESFLSEAPKLGSLNRGDGEYYDDEEEVDDNPEEEDEEDQKDQLKEFWVRNKKHLNQLLLKLKSMKHDVSNPRKILQTVQKIFDTAYYDKEERLDDGYYDVVTKTAQQQVAHRIQSEFNSKNDRDFAFALYDYFDGSQLLGFLNSEKLRKKLEKELNI